MRTFLRFLITLTLITWLGGIIFFSAIAAPATFMALDVMKGGQHLAGEVISRSLYGLHSLGIVCGMVFLLASMALHKGLRRLTHLLVLLMLALTLISQDVVTPRITASRSFLVEREEPVARAQFDKLHRLSVDLEGAILLLGIYVVWLSIKETQK